MFKDYALKRDFVGVSLNKRGGVCLVDISFQTFILRGNLGFKARKLT